MGAGTLETTRPRRSRVAALLVAAALAAGACSSEDEAGTETGGDTGGSGVESTTSTAGTGGGGGGGGATDWEVPERFAGHTSEVYGDDENWLCRPDLATDLCRDDLDATRVDGAGATDVVDASPDLEAPVDCFYVYPTVNLVAVNEGDSNDLAMADDITAETVVVRTQAAPFAPVCRVYAPIYRQVLMSGFGAGEAAFDMAYDDVVDAFSTYMATYNQGRPFVLIGHSQGTGMLSRLMVDHIDGDDELQPMLVSALLIGGQVTVPAGEDVGGSFETIPLCREQGQTGCVVAYNSISAAGPPSAGSRWADTEEEGMVRACTNPAALGGGEAPLRSQVVADADWVPGLEAATGYLRFDDALSGECRTEGELSWFEVSDVRGAGDERVIGRLTDNSGPWDLHIVDMNVAMVDLVELVAAQIEAVAG